MKLALFAFLLFVAYIIITAVPVIIIPITRLGELAIKGLSL